MPITPQDYNDDAIKGSQLERLLKTEIFNRLKGGVPETIASALCAMAAEIDTLKAALAASNLGDRVADSLDAQTLKVGGEDVTDASNHTATFSQASSRTNLTTGEKLSAMFGNISKWLADLKTVAFTGSYNDLSNKPTIPAAVTVDQTYNASSSNPQSGTAVAGAISTKQDSIGQKGSENQPVYFDQNGAVQACPLTTDDPNDVVVNFRVVAARYANSAGSANTATDYNQSVGTIKTALEQKQNVIGNKGSAAQPVYFDANGAVQVIPIDQSVGGTCLSLFVSNANYANSAESASIATKDSVGQQINTTYLRISDAALTYARIVNVRAVENHTYSLQGISTDTTAFEINFLGYDQLPAGRPTLLLISMQYECAGGTALSFKFKYGNTTLGASSLPDGRHYVTLPVVWNAAHSVLTQNPFSLCFSGVSGASIHVMGGSLTLM